MIPLIFHFKYVNIYTFGVFLVLAFFWGCFLVWKTIRLTAYKEEDIFDCVFWSLGGGIFVGRLVHVILHFDKFGTNILKFILINGYPGLSLYGFLLGGFLFLYLTFLYKKINFSEVVDYFVPAIFVALGFGKLGSFFAGTEPGTKTSFFLSIKYAESTGLRHLTPFYESALFFLGAYFAYKLLFSIRRDKFHKGFSLYFFVWHFSAVTLLFDPLKENHTVAYGISVNFIVSAVLLLTLSLYFIYYFRSLLQISLKKATKFTKSHGKRTGQITDKTAT